MENTDLARFIRDVPDFPRKGILFKDITPLIKEPQAFHAAIDRLAAPWEGHSIDVVVGVESRGFLFAAPLAYKLGAGFVPVRKAGRLPSEALSISYDLEYGSNSVEIHRDAIKPDQRVLVVDDLLATGGTILATTKLIEQLGGEVVGLSFLVELSYLGGRENLADAWPIHSLISYNAEVLI